MSGVLIAAAWVLAIAGIVCGALGLAGRMERGTEHMPGLFALSDACFVIRYLLQPAYLPAAWFTVCGAACAWSWWNHHSKHPRKRKAAATLGAKSRALRDALVRKVRELTPRPALRPVPVPA